MKRHLFDNVYYVGACDKTKALFENLFPIPEGMRYNSYIIKDEKTALLDTADVSVRREFTDNVTDTLDGAKLDYLVVHHAEPDHSSVISEVMDSRPETTLVTSATALKFITQFCGKDYSSRTKIVKEGDILDLGKHSLKFIAAPLVHWPEVMVSYDEHIKTLFSADAFGSFGSSEGNLFISSLENTDDWVDEARRYYTNIVGRFGTNTAALLKKAASLKIEKICPLHGLIFDKNCEYAVKKYSTWAAYSAESDDVLIVYGSMYGHTKAAADMLSAMLAERGKNSKTVDVSYTDFSYIIADCFKYVNFVFACPTYYNTLYPKIEQLFSSLRKLNLSSRHIGFIENGTWAPNTVKLMKDALLPMTADIDLPSVTIKSSVDQSSVKQLEALADALCK